MMKVDVVLLVALVAGSVFAEPPHAFRSRLVTVHRVDRRDMAVRPETDEYAFRDGVQIVVPDGAPALVRHAAEDFAKGNWGRPPKLTSFFEFGGDGPLKNACLLGFAVFGHRFVGTSVRLRGDCGTGVGFAIMQSFLMAMCNHLEVAV